ncbi:MAG: hypothetical protein PHY93_20310, partial [Bacteriovorax sp.]|nr:hypothetical protein [Bacteriovorax sp.]
MKYLVTIILLATLVMGNYAHATAKAAFELSQNDKSKDKNKKIAHELIDGGFYFSAIPYINNYLEDHVEIDAQLENDIETLVVKTGTMAVLNLEEKKLEKFSIPSISLILGTRLFNKEQYEKAYEILSRIPETHKFAIEANLMK